MDHKSVVLNDDACSPIALTAETSSAGERNPMERGQYVDADGEDGGDGGAPHASMTITRPVPLIPGSRGRLALCLRNTSRM